MRKIVLRQLHIFSAMVFTAATLLLLVLPITACTSKSESNPPATTKLEPPQNLLVTSADSQVELNWNVADAEFQFTIYVSSQPGIAPQTCPGISCETIPNTTPPYIYSGLTNLAHYYFVVTATKNGEESGPSNEEIGIPLAAAPAIEESGWALTNVNSFSNPQSAHYNPRDHLLYVAKRASNVTDGLYRINADGSSDKVADADRPSAIVVDHATGNIFLAEDYAGALYRTDFGTTGRALWVSGFRSGDDDPVGMAVAPAGYSGAILQPNQALVVDRGFVGAGSGIDDIWRFSSEFSDTVTGYEETLAHADDGTLIDAVDIAIGNNAIYVADSGMTSPGVIYQLVEGGILNPINTVEALSYPSGIVVDPDKGDLLVHDTDTDRVVRIVVATGAVSNVITGLHSGLGNWAALDISPDGSQLFVTDNEVNLIYTFTNRLR